MSNRENAIECIFDRHTDAVFITNTGYISRAVYDMYPKNKNIFYMQGSMGLAPCIGLGMAANANKEIVVLSGDASLLMHLGITHTIADRCLDNLFVYVLDNGCHESVGEFWSSQLEDSYLGINEIISIENDGKKDRVKLDAKTNTKQIKDLF
jgi:thiamine pyrophosphate-dependent acetolactate synthase large subunit-like protein